MVKHAVILLPDLDPALPPYLLATVASLPLLDRQIYSLWRAGVASVTILASPQTRADLAAHLAQLKPKGVVKVVCDWDGVWRETLDPQDDSPRLALLANVFPIPRVFGEFVRLPVAADALALAIVRPDPEDRPVKGLVRPTYHVTGEDQLVTSLRLTLSWETPHAVGLALFSKAAWQDWRRWQRHQHRPEAILTVPPEALLFSFIAQRAQEKQVIGVDVGARVITVIHHNQDLVRAAARLIEATEGSPWGEGYLESAVNRRLARKILPHLLSSRLTPNEITGVDLLVGLAAVALFSHGAYWANVAAAMLLLLVIVLDTMDGLMARLTFRETRLGVMLDLYGDTILNFLVFGGIAIGQYRVSGNPFFLVLLIPLALGYLGCWSVLSPFGRDGRASERPPPSVALEAPELGLKGKLMAEAASRDFFYLILLSALFDVLDWLISLIAVGAIGFAVLLYLYRRRGRI
jgi:phosphatidylglycerophosphate synthase